MLGKLLKYEIKAMGRIMLPLYVVMMFAAGLFAVSLRITSSGPVKVLMERFTLITGVLFMAVILGVGVVMAIMIVLRFYKNLLGTEGYLMFTLPVKTHEHIISKALGAFLWIVVGVASGVLSGLMMVGILSSVPDFLSDVMDVWNTLFSGTNAQQITMIVIMLIVGIFEALCKVYAAMAVGHEFGTHRLIGSVVAYVCFGIVELILTSILRAAHVDLGGIAVSMSGNGILEISSTVTFTIVAGLIGIAVYGGLCWYLLDRKLNLE